MRRSTLTGIARRRFVHCVNQHHTTVRELVSTIGLPPGDICKVITGQDVAHLPLLTYFRIAQWLRMPLINTVLLGGKQPAISELIRLGMAVRGYTPTNARDQLTAAAEITISVAVFRRALHDYDDFRPALHTCDKLAQWLSWTGFDTEDIAIAAGMLVRYLPDGRRITITPQAEQEIKPYPCACGRAGCMIPAHITHGPRPKWRNHAWRM
ncbi:MAG: hypothetical protein K8S97_06375 [Anaerolineae bacterium]|nr:hypothetical protein [Anaerolineae bacterium]